MVVQAKIAILIMAAGESTRMGRPKQLLDWKDSNLLNHSISKVIELQQDHVFVVLGANSDFIKPKIESKQVSILINNNWKKGLGNSIKFGVYTISMALPGIEGILVMLADQPLIEQDHYAYLINRFTPDSDQILATEYSDGKLGVPALFDKTYFHELNGLNSELGAKHIIQKYSDSVESVKNAKANIDVDTFDQYLKFYKENHP